MLVRQKFQKLFEFFWKMFRKIFEKNVRKIFKKLSTKFWKKNRNFFLRIDAKSLFDDTFFCLKSRFSRQKFFDYRIFFRNFGISSWFFLGEILVSDFRPHWIRVFLGCPEPIPVTKNAGDRPQSSVNLDPGRILVSGVVPSRGYGGDPTVSPGKTGFAGNIRYFFRRFAPKSTTKSVNCLS